MSNQGLNRIGYIDFLKSVGLSCIILAHVGPPDIIAQFRCFDVPMMVILSSLLAKISFSKYRANILSIGKYYVSRFKRLVVPTWIFLTFYFLLNCLFGKTYSIKYYIDSFCLTRYGIGYVWIILIYFYCALLVPLYDKYRFTAKHFAVAAMVYLIYEVLCFYHVFSDIAIVDTTYYYIIPYGFIAYLGYNFTEIKKETRTKLIIGSAIAFTALAVYYLAIHGSLQPVYIVKYPPRLYYLSYGVMCSFVLLAICEKKQTQFFSGRLIRYISTHSLWIYLWHILILDVYSTLKLPNIWYIKFIIVFGMSILVDYLVNIIAKTLELKTNLAFFRYLQG